MSASARETSRPDRSVFCYIAKMALTGSGLEALPAELWLKIFLLLPVRGRWGHREVDHFLGNIACLKTPGVPQVEGSLCM